MEETHYHAKRMRPLGKRRVAALAAVLVLLLGIAAAGVRYFDFVSRTVYEESTAHLAEVLHQSNNMLNEVVEKNLTYLHLWETTMRHISDEDEIRQLIEAVQQETGFSDFYFLSADGNYMTAAGETGYLGIQDDLEDRITQGGDIVMTAVLPGKPEMLVFACPENQGTYRGFAYDAVAVSYYNDDIVKVLDISAFDGTASRYVLHPDGRIIINCAAQMEEDVYNLLAAMQERSPLTSEDIQTLSDDFSQGRSGSRLVTLDGTDLRRMKPRPLARRMAMLRQLSDLAYAYTVEEVVAMGRYAHRGLLQADNGGAEAVERALQAVQLQDKRRQNILTLSGGERQRMLLAQVLCQEPDVLLLDEPGNHLDLRFQQELFLLIDAWRREPGHAVVSVVHDLSLARKFGTHALLLSSGRGTYGEISAILTPAALESAWQMDVVGWLRSLGDVWQE